VEQRLKPPAEVNCSNTVLHGLLATTKMPVDQEVLDSMKKRTAKNAHRIKNSLARTLMMLQKPAESCLGKAQEKLERQSKAVRCSLFLQKNEMSLLIVGKSFYKFRNSIYFMSKSFLFILGLSFILVSFSSYAAVTLPEEGADFPSQLHLIHLSKGWNIIGYTLDTETPVDKIKSICKLEPYEGHEIYEYTGDQNDPWTYPDKFQAPKGYYINSKEECSVVLSGKVLKMENLALKSGWNLIASPKLVTFNSVLGSCKGKLDDENYVLGLDEDTGKMDFRTSVMELGNAYWVFAKDNCEFDFSDRKQVPPQKGEIKELSFKSNALEEERKYFIYLPPSYSTSSRRYPVLYLLHGAGLEGKFMPWINQAHIDEILENLIAEYGIEEMILVMPTHGRSGLENGCSGPAEIGKQVCGNYEDYIVKDLIPLIDSTYRTVNDKSAGVSWAFLVVVTVLIG